MVTKKGAKKTSSYSSTSSTTHSPSGTAASQKHHGLKKKQSDDWTPSKERPPHHHVPPVIKNLIHVAKPFKNPRYTTPRKHKNLKQLLAGEKVSAYVELPTYTNIEAPPSLKPAKKYCDVTGLEAIYTDPKTGLRYHSLDVYQYIRQLHPNEIQQYLSLRNAAVVLK